MKTPSNKHDKFGGGDRREMIYVDDAKVVKHGRPWFHLMADSIDELHEFAKRIGVSTHAFHRGAKYPHYDIGAGHRSIALKYGARSISSREAVLIGQRITSAGHRAAEQRQLALFSIATDKACI